VIIGAADLMKPGEIKVKGPGTIKVIFGEPLYPNDFNESMAAFKEKTFQVMLNLIQQYR
jgi:1-acyl-sn-glycerol-3-phosphate acyltransferase